MTLESIKKVAVDIFLPNLERMKRIDAIRAAQRSRGTLPCYAMDLQNCDKESCEWRESCRREARMTL